MRSMALAAAWRHSSRCSSWGFEWLLLRMAASRAICATSAGVQQPAQNTDSSVRNTDHFSMQPCPGACLCIDIYCIYIRYPTTISTIPIHSHDLREIKLLWPILATRVQVKEVSILRCRWVFTTVEDAFQGLLEPGVLDSPQQLCIPLPGKQLCASALKPEIVL